MLKLTSFERAWHSGVERIISLASPTAALRRNHQRKVMEFAYDAANPGRARGQGYGTGNRASESLRNQTDRVKMMWDIRDLTNNISLIKSIQVKEAMYVCGKVQYQANTGDPNVDAIVEQFMGQWAEQCDMTGRHDLDSMIQLGHMSMRRDGDFGWILANEGPLVKLQAVEADRIGDPAKNGQEENYFGGVKVNDLGQPVFYRVFERTIHGQYRNPVEIEPGAFIHYFDPMRADQYRGVTAFDTAIPHARDLYELFQMEKLAVKWGASHAGVVAKQDPGFDWSQSTVNGTPVQTIEPGKILRLEPGESVTMFQTSSRPSPTFNGFIEALIREVANGLVLPYSFVWDMAALGGASARIELAMAQRSFLRSQHILTAKVLNKIRNAVLQRAAAFGLIPNIPTLMSGKWQFTAYITADEGYQTQADIAELQQGLKTRNQIYAERGMDFETETDTIVREVQYLQQKSMESGIPIELLTQGLPNATMMLAQMQMATTATESGEDAPGHPEEDDKKGEKKKPAKKADKKSKK
jgi:lambda family phage portal protein